MRLRTWAVLAFSTAILVLPAGAAPPSINSGGVVNAADYTANLSRGIIFSIFGSNLAPATASAKSVPLPTTLEGVTVEITEASLFPRLLKAPLFFVSSGQINAQLPYNLDTSTLYVRVRTAEGLSNSQEIRIASRTPRLFTWDRSGSGDAILVHADYRLVTASAPAAPNEVLMLYLTGLGEVTPAVAAGQAGGDGAGLGPLNRVTDTVVVEVNGNPSTVHFAGLAPGFVGLYQINFQVPADAGSGQLAITVGAANQESQARVNFACASGSPPVASASIGPAGGTVSGSGFQLTIPSGAFQSASQMTVSRGDPATGALSARYRLEGLPPSVAADLTVSLDLTATPPAGSTVFVRLRPVGSDETSLFLDGSVQGGRVVATIPATEMPWRTPSSKPGEARQAAPSQSFRTEQYVRMDLEVTGLRPTAQSKQFSIYYERISPEIANQISQTLDAAAQKLAQLGFDLTKYSNWPLPVFIFEFDKPSDPNKAETFGFSVYYPRSGKAVLELNARKSQQASDMPNLAGTAIHELLHILQAGYHAVGARKDDPVWFWMDEAAAVWVSRRMVSDPAFIPMEISGSEIFFSLYPLQRTLDESAENKEAERIEVEHHGYGAAQLLEVLTRNHPLKEKVIPALFEYRTTHRGDSPLLALQMVLDDLGADWLRFCAEWMDGKIYGQNWPDYLTVRKGVWGTFRVPENDQLDETGSWDAPPLMAKIWGLRTDHHLHLGTRMKISLDEPAGQSEMLVYAVDDSKGRPTLYKLYRGRGPYEHSDISKLVTRQTLELDGNYYVFVMVPNLLGLQGKPTTPIKVRMELKPAAATIAVAPASLSFSATQGGANPPNQSLAISNSGGGTLNWSASVLNGSWVKLSGATSGTNSGTVPVGVNISGLTAGTYQGTVRISATGASNTPKDVPISLTVTATVPDWLKDLGMVSASFAIQFTCTQGGQVLTGIDDFYKCVGGGGSLRNGNPYTGQPTQRLTWKGLSFSLDPPPTYGPTASTQIKLEFSGTVSAKADVLETAHFKSTWISKDQTVVWDFTFKQIPLVQTLVDHNQVPYNLRFAVSTAQLRADPKKYVVDATFRRIYTNTTIPVADVIGQPDWNQFVSDPPVSVVFQQ